MAVPVMKDGVPLLIDGVPALADDPCDCCGVPCPCELPETITVHFEEWWDPDFPQGTGCCEVSETIVLDWNPSTNRWEGPGAFAIKTGGTSTCSISVAYNPGGGCDSIAHLHSISCAGGSPDVEQSSSSSRNCSYRSTVTWG